MRLTTGRIDNTLPEAKNTLTQRTIGPVSTGETYIDVSNMKEGDAAGLTLLQQKYGWVGVKYEEGSKYISMVTSQSGTEEEVERIPLEGENIYLKATCDFTDLKDVANFYYSLDGEEWHKIGSELQMQYTMPHFMGYRFGLFNFATKETGGYVDFDYFNIKIL